MNLSYATLIEIQQTQDGARKAIINWPGGKRPLPGQYIQAFNPVETHAPAPVSLFAGGLPESNLGSESWMTAPTIPTSWNPAEKLLLRGPLGNGFSIPDGASRIALTAFGNYTDFLLPIAGQAISGNREVALFTDSPFPQLPTSIEVNPLSALGDGMHWADYVAGCTNLQTIPETRSILRKYQTIPSTELLVLTPMPCGAMASCGVCGFRSGNGRIIMVCEEGPVIPWQNF